MGFLPTLGLENSSNSPNTSPYMNKQYFGAEILDQTPSIGFQREGYTASFLINGMKFLQVYIIAFAIVLVLRYIAAKAQFNPYD